MTRPKALFLDDERWRHEAFEDRNRDRYDVWHAFNMAQFSKLFAEHTFELISLDHDLVDPVVSTVDDGFKLTWDATETGMDAVELIGVSSVLPRPKIIVHSWNSRAAGAMMARLRELGLDPIRQSFESKQTQLSREAEERFAARCEKEAARERGREGEG